MTRAAGGPDTTRRLMVGLLLVVAASVGLGMAAGRQETAAELHRRAFDLLRDGKPAKALELYDRILAGDPTDANALYQKALALALSGRKREAVGCLQQAIDAGFTELARLTQDPPMAELRSEEAFGAILREYDVVLKEERAPSLESIKRILAEPRFHRFLPRLLPRYRPAELTGDTLQLLGSPDPRLVRAAVVSLLHQNADDPTIRARVAGLLGSPQAEVREAAAEYFLWQGSEEDREALAAAVAKERDPFTLSAESDALRLIATRKGWATPASEEKSLPTDSRCQEALSLLRARPTPEVLRQAAAVYRLGWSIEPKLIYSGPDVDEEALAGHRACFDLARAIFGFSRKPLNAASRSSEDPPVATSFMAPVRDYFNSGRRSFGGHTGTRGPFASSVHAGDDVAWNRDDGTVVSTADGIVRLVSHTYSWGFIVVVEHRLPKREGYYCSLYAHLSPSIRVAAGQVVRKGQRIGSVGRSYTWENGGYPAHLHFGIHRGRYLQSRPWDRAGSLEVGDGQSPPMPVKQDASWICGYVAPARWDEGRHGWVDPQQFIGRRMEGSGGPP